AWTDPGAGVRLRAKPKPVRYEHDEPGELVHVDDKKLGRIPHGGGHRPHRRAQRKRITKGPKPGPPRVHNDRAHHSRPAYSEALPDETKETTAAFWHRANDYFAACGIIVKRVLTDNGAAYRSKAFATALGEQVTHKRTRPYRPQTNGK